MTERRRARRRGLAPLRGIARLLWGALRLAGRALRGLWRLGPGQQRDGR